MGWRKRKREEHSKHALTRDYPPGSCRELSHQFTEGEKEGQFPETQERGRTFSRGNKERSWKGRQS